MKNLSVYFIYSFSIAALLILFLNNKNTKIQFTDEQFFDGFDRNLTQFAKRSHARSLPDTFLPGFRSNRTVEFYVYEGPGFDFYEDCFEYYGPDAKRNPPMDITDRQYKHAGSFKFLEGIENHAWRVKDPELAKIFVVPALLGQVIRRGRCRGKSAKKMIQDLVFNLGRSKHWKRNNGLDHVLLDTDYRIEGTDKNLKQIRKYLKNMTVGHHVNYPLINLNDETGLKKNFQRDPRGCDWACTVLVPMNEREIHRETSLNYEDFKNRPNDLFFMGQWDERAGYRTRTQISKIIKNNEFHGLNYIYTNVKQYGGLQDCNFKVCLKHYNCHCKSGPRSWNLYPKLLGQSKFALAMSGDNAGSTRYFDAPNSGLIPIFIADQAFTDALPFTSKVPWRDFSFFIPETGNSEDLAAEIRSIVNSDDRILRRKFEMLMRYRDELSWTRNAGKVGENFIEEAWDRCVQPFIKNSDLYGK